MKKIASILLIIFGLMSCTQEITRNNPSLQGLKDGILWRARDSQAVLDLNGTLTITGLTQYETLILKTNSPNPQTYTLGNSNSKLATYGFSKDGVVLNYATGVSMGDGEIIIEDFDEDNMTITGTFRFNAKNTDNTSTGPEIVNYQEGHFYKVPVIPGS